MHCSVYVSEVLMSVNSENMTHVLTETLSDCENLLVQSKCSLILSP